jgi:hypothetical protein
MRIGLFIPCCIDAFFPEVVIATLELLEPLGHEVVDPRDQTCCGQPMANSGFNRVKTTPRHPIQTKTPANTDHKASADQKREGAN